MTSDACALDDARLTLAGLLFETHAGLSTELERRLERDAGLSRQWFEVLLRLARSPDGRLRMTDLAHQVLITSSGLTRAVDRMEEAGLVKREACPSDRRVSWCTLTAKGRRRIERAIPKHVADLDDVFARHLDARERDDLEAILRKLRDALRPESTAGAAATAGQATAR